MITFGSNFRVFNQYETVRSFVAQNNDAKRCPCRFNHELGAMINSRLWHNFLFLVSVGRISLRVVNTVKGWRASMDDCAYSRAIMWEKDTKVTESKKSRLIEMFLGLEPWWWFLQQTSSRMILSWGFKLLKILTSNEVRAMEQKLIFMWPKAGLPQLKRRRFAVWAFRCTSDSGISEFRKRWID